MYNPNQQVLPLTPFFQQMLCVGLVKGINFNNQRVGFEIFLYSKQEDMKHLDLWPTT